MRAAHAEGARGRAQNALTNLGLKPLCCALRVLGALEAPAPDYVAKHAAALVKLLVRLAKEHAQGNPSLILAPQPAQPGQPLRCAPPPSAAVPSSGACALRAPADSRLAHALRLRVRRAPRPPGGPRPTARAPRRRPQDEGGEPEYGTMVWAMCAALKLAAPRVLFTELVKKQFLQARPRPGRPEFTNLLAPACGLLARRAAGRATWGRRPCAQTLVMVITGGPARHVHGAIVLRILAILRDWLLAPPPGGSLTLKEAVLFLQRLAHMLAMGVLRGQTAAAFERVFLQLLLTLCTPSAHPPSPALRAAHGRANAP